MTSRTPEKKDTLESNSDYRAYMSKLHDIGASDFSAWDFDPMQVVDELNKKKRVRRATMTARRRAGLATSVASNKASATKDDDDDADNDFEQENEDDRIIPTFVDEFEHDNEHADVSTDEAERLRQEEDSQLALMVDETTIPGAIPAVPYIWIKNLVMTCTTDQRLNLNWLLQRGQRYGFSRNERRFVALTMRCLNPRTSTLVFSNGKFVNTGSQKCEDARESIEKMVAIIREMRDEDGCQPYADIRLKKSEVHNVVGSTRVPFRIDLKVLDMLPSVRYVEDEFVGAIVSVSYFSKDPRDAKVKALVFDTGNLVIMGTRSPEHIEDVYKLLYPRVARAAVQNTLPAEFRVTKSQLRRAKSDKRKIDELPSGSRSVIAVDQSFQVQEFQRVNDGRASGRQLLDLDRAQRAGRLSGIDRNTHNLLALHSMAVHENEQDHRQMKQLENREHVEQLRVEGLRVQDSSKYAEGNAPKRIRQMSKEESAQLYVAD